MARIRGGRRDDVLVGTTRDDWIEGLGGNDRITPRGGDDRVDGGTGIDTVILGGPVADYRITRGGNTTTIDDRVPGNGDDGTDVLRDVEVVRFTDYTLYLDHRNNRPVAVDDQRATDEDTAITIRVADLLANDLEFDRDRLRFTGLDTSGTQGTVRNNGNGTLTYDPGDAFQHLAAGETAEDEFVYRISDGRGGTDTATVTITITGTADGVQAIDLGDLNGTTGFKIIGETELDRAGASVAMAGDVNGDGFDDVILGSPGFSVYGFYHTEGAAYVVFGKASGFDTVDVGDLGGTDGFAIIRPDAAPYDLVGFSVSTAGDINGDGFDDVIVGAPGFGNLGINPGNGYVVFGKASGFGTVDLDDVIGGIGGFRMLAQSNYDQVGYSVSTAGDINGDGFDDLLVGAPQVTRDGDYYTGAVYVVFGRASGLDSFGLGEIEAGSDRGFLIVDEGRNTFAGHSTAGIGDVNGDGFDDVIVSAALYDAAYVVFGRADAPERVVLSDVADGIGGFAINRESTSNPNQIVVLDVAAAGDVNGDGLADMLVGGSVPNTVHVVFGKAAGAAVSLSDVAAGTGGFTIVGENAGDLAGAGVSTAGDVNGDGLVDLLIGAPGNDAGGDGAGAAYLVFGRASGFTTIDLNDVAAGVGGLKIIGENAGDAAGTAVAAAGDVNNDGFDDVMIGAPGNDAGGSGAGAAYVLFGGPSLGGPALMASMEDADLLLM